MTAYKVCIVTVTYGDRWRFLEQVIQRVLSFEQVAKVVVVNNASAYNMPVPYDEKVLFLNNIENEGSAGGYHQGIEYAFENIECDFIWLLDDDNLPETGCLDKLLAQWDKIPGADNKKAGFCFRDDRPTHVKIARGESPGRYYLVTNNFLGFHVGRILYNQYHKFTDKFKTHLNYKEHVAMPYVPYGGLLMHKSLVADIGYPDERFYLYVDDSEYSYRITQNGGTIWLIPECKVVDIDKSQGINYKKRLFHSQLLDQWNFRNYYHLRNRIYFYSGVAVKNNFVFKLNKALYLAFLHAISVLSGKTTEYRKLVNAVDDGLKGNLGKANPNKF